MAVNLQVYIEIDGNNILVGALIGNDKTDTRFIYNKDYLSNKNSKPISISLPLQNDFFSPDKTSCFFEGLLPEGFTRKCIANQMKIQEDDYIEILKNLGKECLGAIQIIDKGNINSQIKYKKLSQKELFNFASEGILKSVDYLAKSHLSLTGASGKIGLYYNKSKWYLPLENAPSTHIIKQSHVRLNNIVANEQLCLLTAKKLGISVPESFIISFDETISKNNSLETILFATKRYDRILGNKVNDKDLVIPLRLHQEDFAQALGIESNKKYEQNGDGYFNKTCGLLEKYSANPMEDIFALWKILLFNYFIGNTDNHIKNSSLLYSKNLSQIRLAPAYDIISTIIYDSSSTDMAISINGKYDIFRITRDDFLNEAKKNNLGLQKYMNEFDKMKIEIFDALKQSKNELCKLGFPEVEKVYDKILKKMKQRG